MLNNHKLFLSVVALSLAFLSLDRARAEDISSLKMSFNDSLSSVLPETPEPKSDTQKLLARKISKQKNDRTGWYIGTMRGANFPNLNAANNNGSGNWTSLDSWASLLDLSNINAFGGYYSSNFRLEGEVMLANNPMRLSSRSSNNFDVTPSGGVPSPTAAPEKCTANSFAMLINGYYDIDLGSSFKPFVGVGLGYSSTNLKDGNQDWGSNSGLTYQIKAGVGYPLSETQDIYLQYKYINLPASYVNSVPLDGVTPRSNPTIFNTIFSVSNIEIGTRFNF